MFININDFVKVLEPFNTHFPDTYQVVSYSEYNSAYLLDNGIEFITDYLEKV